ncbi:MAG: hypothetical protein ACKVQB_07345 [Bacteroidia bacterium]
MSITFTEDDLILFIYGEANEALDAEIKTTLITDKSLQEVHISLLAVTNELGSTRFQPHDTSIKIIMEESALSQREKIF